MGRRVGEWKVDKFQSSVGVSGWRLITMNMNESDENMYRNNGEELNNIDLSGTKFK